MTIFQAMVLGLVQGLTEFLPVSSSGHLVLARPLLGLPAADGPAFEVIVHLGTLVSVLIVLFGDVFALLRATPLLLRRSAWSESYRESDAFRALVLLVPATIPTVIVGLLFKDEIDEAFGSTHLVLVMLLVTGVILLFTRRSWGEQKSPLGLKIAALMGLAQAFAILPGISRSGSTIATGLVAEGERKTVGHFSFLMSIPAILGALVLKAKDIAELDVRPLVLVVGFLAATTSGTVALKLLLRLVQRGRLWIFAPYLFVVAILGLLFA